MRILGVVLLAFAAMVAVPSTAARAGGKTPIDEAVEHFAAGRFDDAIASTEKVAADDPLRARAAYLAGEVSIARGDALGAEAYLREALDKKQAAPVFAALGRALLLQGKAADAVEPLA
jgi:predicted Zn-dependent protease